MLAEAAQADSACPFSTGLFIRMVAEAAEEDRRAGKTRITPYWRTIKDDGGLNEKFPGGVRAQAARLRKEGFTVQPGKGKQPPRVRIPRSTWSGRAVDSLAFTDACRTPQLPRTCRINSQVMRLLKTEPRP